MRHMRPVPAAETRSSWSNFRQALAVVAYRPHLRQTIRVALVVGTILFSINQLDAVLRHQATVATWLKGALTYLVPAWRGGRRWATHATCPRWCRASRTSAPRCRST
jgi:hypothetical protein